MGDKGGETPVDIVQLVKVELDFRSPQPQQLKRMEIMYRVMRKYYVQHFMEHKRQWELMGPLHAMSLHANNAMSLHANNAKADGATASTASRTHSSVKSKTQTLSYEPREGTAGGNEEDADDEDASLLATKRKRIEGTPTSNKKVE